jgi:site-specific DNA recombinase
VDRAAVYTRVSTSGQGDGASLTTQKNDCFRYCETQGLVTVAEFEDLQSGLKADRINYLEMLRQAEAGAFDVIVCWKMDRFGRDRLESGFQLRELSKIGVRVDSATEPNDSPLLRNILMDFAEEESRRISMRVSANKRTLAQMGKRTNKAPFGYKSVPHSEKGRTLEPNEDAPVVAELFEMYATGRQTLADLRDHIEHQSTTPMRPRTRAGVRRILVNPIYAGFISYGIRSRSGIVIKTKQQIKADAFEVKGQHPAIVDEVTFRKVQAMLQNNQPKGKGRPHSTFLFSGMIWCGCGYRLTAKHTKPGTIMYYCCRRANAGDCDSRSVSERRIREKVLGPIEHLLSQLNQQDVRAAVRANLMENDQRERAKSHAVKQGLGDKLARLEKRLTTWLEMVGDGDMTREQYAKLRAEYEPQIEDLQAQLAARPHLVVPDMEAFFAIADALEGEPPDDQEWRDIIEGMVEKVIIEGHDIRVVWKDAFQPLMQAVSES